uniref:Integrin beta n=1 Tax=Magallana gigas TaxID=29159 RepID=K1QI90_MAGGI
MLLFGLIIICLVANVCSQACSGARCGDCLINDGCGWCKDSEFSFPRCAPINQLTDNGCVAVIKRKEHVVQLLQNDEFSDGGPGLEPVQIKPQRIKIRLTPNSQLRNVMVFYKIAKNFPLDLYFLNDPSYTMRQLTSSLNLLANDIANDIATLTTDFTFGLGTSMDKVVSPFTRQDPKYLATPCGTTSIPCDFPYSFIHRQSLTNDITAFTNAVRGVNTTGNQDIVEGLLDGLMQVMVCGDRIGWRKKSRRMVIYATDINFHHAGDGRVAGILQPNDGLCHLDSNGKYTMAEVQDYPSVGQILQKARENNINIIFVIGGAENEFIRNNYYDKFATYLPGGFNNASELTTDGSNILNIVGSSYRRLRETVKLVMTKVPEELDVEIYSNCRTGRILDKTNNCTGLTLEKWTNFTLFLFSNMTTCPDQRTVNFTIFPEGLEERVEIEVEHVCDCDCQLEPEAESNSTRCNQRGTYECGVCHCNEGWSGDSCECDERGSETEACGTEAGICSNAGNCTCRKCDCFEGFSGDKCECNDRNCPYFNGNLCGGPSNGRCSCGSCVCDPAYSGRACDCMTSTEACKDSNGTLCSDKGNCVCGKCECSAGFRGEVCERCQSCPGTCSTNNDCVECVGFNQGAYNQSVCLSKCGNVETVAIFLEPGNETTTTSCILQDNFGCLIYYNSENPIYKECVTTVQNPMHDIADVSHDEIANETSHI